MKRNELFTFDYIEYVVADDRLTIDAIQRAYSAPFTTELTGLVAKSTAQYKRELRSAIRGLWSGALDIDQAFASFDASIQRNLSMAWNEGAAKCGIQPSELSADEQSALRRTIANESSRVFSFLLNVEANNRANKGKLTPLYGRLEMWVLRYGDTVNQAQVMACADRKLMWLINYVRAVKKNCPSCLKLNNKVKRASYWYGRNVRPQNPPNPYLICGGWICGCGFDETDQPLSKGPLPNLP